MDQQGRSGTVVVSNEQRGPLLMELFNSHVEVPRGEVRQISDEDCDRCLRPEAERLLSPHGGGSVHAEPSRLQHYVCAGLNGVHGYRRVTGHHQYGAD
jgi:hypothetical protein